MSEPFTLSSAILDSDDDDGDYVPGEQDCGSENDDEPKTKKPRIENSTPAPVVADPVASDAARNALWESFLESTVTSASGSGNITPASETKTITIERKHRFAGEDVIEKVQVAEDSAEAAEWKARQWSNPTAPEPTFVATASSPPSLSASRNASLGTNPPRSSSADHAKKVPSPVPAKAKPTAKPRKSLSAMAAAAKPKKLTTLEKSRLDWQSHLSTVTTDERDELERNRQAGGTSYLEKVDFLARVGERREGVFEDSKRKRR